MKTCLILFLLSFTVLYGQKRIEFVGYPDVRINENGSERVIEKNIAQEKYTCVIMEDFIGQQEIT